MQLCLDDSSFADILITLETGYYPSITNSKAYLVKPIHKKIAIRNQVVPGESIKYLQFDKVLNYGRSIIKEMSVSKYL